MRSIALLASLACFSLSGCIGGDDESSSGGDARGPGAVVLTCPNGELPNTATFDLGENPGGEPQPRGAVARFLREQKADLTAQDFDRIDPLSTSPDKARFAYSEDGSRRIGLYLERLKDGWLVIAYEFCRGAL